MIDWQILSEPPYPSNELAESLWYFQLSYHDGILSEQQFTDDMDCIFNEAWEEANPQFTVLRCYDNVPARL